MTDERQSSSYDRVFSHTRKANIGLITAATAITEGNTEADNESRNMQLLENIRSSGFGFLHIRGRAAGIDRNGEPTLSDVHAYLVIGSRGDDSGKMKGFLSNFGEVYGQNCVVYKPFDSQDAVMIGTKEGVFPGKGETYQLGKWHPDRTAEFLNIMKGKEILRFSEGLVQDKPAYFNSKSFFSRVETEY